MVVGVLLLHVGSIPLLALSSRESLRCERGAQCVLTTRLFGLPLRARSFPAAELMAVRINRESQPTRFGQRVVFFVDFTRTEGSPLRLYPAADSPHDAALRSRFDSAEAFVDGRAAAFEDVAPYTWVNVTGLALGASFMAAAVLWFREAARRAREQRSERRRSPIEASTTSEHGRRSSPSAGARAQGRIRASRRQRRGDSP